MKGLAGFATVLSIAASAAHAEHSSYDLTTLDPDAISYMCDEISLLSPEDISAIDPLTFLQYHERALPKEFIQEYEGGASRANSGKDSLIRGFVVDPGSMLERALPAAIPSIQAYICDPAETLKLYCPSEANYCK